MQGPYGSYHLSESVLQSLWNNGDFSRDGLLTESGKKISLIHSGRWNFFEGPDFLEAIIEVECQSLWLDWWVGDQLNQWNLLIKRALDEAYRIALRNAWVQGVHAIYLKSNDG